MCWECRHGGGGSSVLRMQPRSAPQPSSSATAFGVVFNRTPMETSTIGSLSRLTLDGTPRTIVGVMPSGFGFPSPDVDVWVPLSDSYRTRSRSARSLQVVGRLGPGTTIDREREALQTLARRLEQDHEVDRGWGVTVATLRESLVGSIRLRLAILFGASGCVLLIACANVSSLLLTRGLGRSREMALRVALGATRGRLMRQQLVESTVIAVLGGLVGVALAAWSLDVLRAAAGFNLPRFESSPWTLACWP